MITILTATGIASSMMFLFFFILPALDRSNTRQAGRVEASLVGSRRAAKPAH